MFLIYVANQNVLIDCVFKVFWTVNPPPLKYFFFYKSKTIFINSNW